MMIRATSTLPAIICLCLTFLLVNCANNNGYKNVQIKNIRVGQTVKLSLNNGSQLQFEVTRKDNHYLYYGSKSVALEDIDKSELVIESSKPDFFLFEFFWGVSAFFAGVSSMF